MPTVPMHFFVPSVLVLLKMYRNTMCAHKLRAALGFTQNTSCNIADHSVKPSPTDAFRTKHCFSLIISTISICSLFV